VHAEGEGSASARPKDGRHIAKGDGLFRLFSGATLYELSAAIYRAAGKLKTTCDADDRFTPPGRLEAREEQLKALQESVEAISPPFSRFESELTDTQKAQLRGVLNLSNTIGQRSVRQ